MQNVQPAFHQVMSLCVWQWQAYKAQGVQIFGVVTDADADGSRMAAGRQAPRNSQVDRQTAAVADRQPIYRAFQTYSQLCLGCGIRSV